MVSFSPFSFACLKVTAVFFIKILISALLLRISDFVASNAQTQIAVRKIYFSHYLLFQFIPNSYFKISCIRSYFSSGTFSCRFFAISNSLLANSR